MSNGDPAQLPGQNSERTNANLDLGEETAEHSPVELALRQSEERYRDLFDNAQDAIYVHDLNGTYISANRAAEKLTGYTLKEIIGKNVADFMPADHAAEVRANITAKLENQGPTTYEIEVLARDGRRVPVEVSSRLIYEKGIAVGVQGMARDITERKRAEAERRALAEIVQGVIITASLDELFALAHQAISKLLPTRNCFVALYDKTSDLLHIPFCRDEFDPIAEPHKLGRGLTAFALRSGRPISLTRPLVEELILRGEVELVGTLPMAWLGVPLRTSTDIIGVLVVQHYHDADAFSRQDLELLTAVGDQLGLAVERKQIEIELRTNEIQLTDAQHIANLGSWEWDVLTDRVHWSDELFSIFGLQPQESGATFAAFLAFVHPDDRQIPTDAIAQAFQDKAFPHYEYRIVRPDGTVRTVQAYGKVIPDDSGRVIKMVGTALDITERKQLEVQLRQERIFLRTLIDNIPDSIYVKDRACRKVIANLAEARILGFQSEAEVLGKDDFAIYPRELAEKFFADDQLVMQSGKPVLNREEYVMDEDEKKRWLLTSKIPLRDESGRIIGLIGLGRDISDRKRMELDLIAARDTALESTRLKSEFLANMSHEIRTPMNGVIGMTELLLDTSLNDEQKEYTQIIHSSADALMGIINDILDFSKIDAGKVHFEKLNFDLLPVIDDVVRLLSHTASAKGFAITSLIDDDVPVRLHGDGGRLRQVLTNLVGNAVKFTEFGAVVLSVMQAREIEGKPKGQVTLRFEIRDTGIGINEQAQQKLFQPFVQADGSTTRKYGGTGLGLAISKQLVELMEGEIGVESKLGEGSNFWFTAVFETQVSSQAEANAPAQPRRVRLTGQANPDRRKKNARILLAEDNAVNQRVALVQLENLGYAVDAVTNGVEALAALAVNRYPIVLMDCQMPEKDGFETTAEIRIREKGSARKTVIIAMTAHALEGEREKCLAAGMDDYLTKPVKVHELEAILGRWDAEPGPSLQPEQPRTRSVTPAPGILDLAVLEGFRELQEADGPDLVEELVELYLNDTTARLADLRAAIGKKETGTALDILHSLKGSSNNLGIRGMAAVCSHFEGQLGNGGAEEAATILTQLDREFESTREALAGELHLLLK